MRPTVASDNKLVVECHLVDFDEKIVGKPTGEIEWVERLERRG
jgi:FAD synthase